MKKTLTLRVENEWIPNQAAICQLQHKNVKEVWIRLIPLNKEQRDARNLKSNVDFLGLLLSINAAHQFKLDLQDPHDYHMHSSEFMLPALEPGHYAIMTSADERFLPDHSVLDHTFVQVTDITAVSRRHEEGGMLIKALDRKTGMPLKGAQAFLVYRDYSSNNREEKTKGPFILNEQGETHIPYKNKIYGGSVRLEHEGQSLMINAYNQDKAVHREYTRVHFFLDRAIYRPGQTVHFKAMAITQHGFNSRIASKLDVHVELKDVNYQKITELKLKTNEFGTCHGSFTLPSSGLTGNMTLQTEHGAISFSVEEYKRPRFEANIKPIEGQFKLGEEVKARGRAIGFNGVPLSDAIVSYTVSRNPVLKWYWGYWRRPQHNQAEVVITVGETKTDENGYFDIDFEALADAGMKAQDIQYFNFNIAADVTDITGETHSASSYVRIGDNAVILDVDVSEEINRDDWTDVKIKATNLSDESIELSGTYELRKLKEIEQVYINRLWGHSEYQEIAERDFNSLFPWLRYNPASRSEQRAGELIKEGTWSADKGIQKSELRGLKNGRYILKATAMGDDGKEYTTEKAFTLYELKKSKAVFTEALKVFASKEKYAPGETAQILLSSKWDKLPVTVYLEHEGKVRLKKDITLNGEQTLIDIRILRAYQSGLRLHVSGVRENRAFHKTLEIGVEEVDRLLDVKLETYRDNMLPGSQEEWRLKVNSRNGEKNIAEILLGMYDASLDQFKMRDWRLSPYQQSYALLSPNPHSVGTSGTYGRAWNERHSQPHYPQLNLPELNQFGYSGYYGSFKYENSVEYDDGLIISESRSYNGSMTFTTPDNSDADMAGNTAGLVSLRGARADGELNGRAYEDKVVSHIEKEISRPQSTSTQVQVRSNFNETAFFYPDLKTDKDGNLIFSFTLPESLTKWKFRALAHTQELQTGSTTQEVISQKELMVVPNPPRFLRQGDEIYLSTKVSNLSDETVTGQVRLELLNAMTNESISSLLGTDSSKPFDIETDKSEAFFWKINVPEEYDAITYRFIAESEDHNDGEEAILPVLSNRMMVHESMPFSIMKESSKDFTFERMLSASASPSLKNHSLTLEFTGNPVWYAVQAMPYMMEYPHECSEQVFTRFYANALSSSIMNKRPRLREVITKWSTLSPESFLSNLEKNQELKYILLEETPWVMESQDESERKKRLSLLMDINHMANKQKQALNKLKKNQLSSGAWPWFRGMRESLYITQHIVSGMGHLQKLEALDDLQAKEMVYSAISYMDAEHSRRYNKLKARKNVDMTKDHTGQFEIQYLYARSFFPDLEVRKNHKEAYEYYAKQAREFWLSDNDYIQAFNALAQHRMGEEEIAKDIMRSLKERSIMDEELGMYWKNYQNSWYWYQPNVEKQAIMVEAFNDVMDDQDAVYGLKQWLIFNKQTNDWKTTKASAEACYALLLGGSDWTADRKFSVQVGDDVFSSDDPALSTEAGTGYLKKTWKESEIDEKLAHVSVKKEGEAPAWGALHWQYFEDLDKITLNENPLIIRKQVSRVNKMEQGESLSLLANGAEINLGDRVRIRMEIETDREMEYVHIKDMRSSGFEPVDVISGVEYSGGLAFYRSTKDASTNYFIDKLNKGTYVLEYDVFATQQGDFSNGITSIQCMYSPEFTSHSEGIRVVINQK